MKINEIHLGDCLELMWQIPDHSIDMVLCDLPYGTTACAWDSIIDLDLLWEHYKRVIKPRGAIVLTASQPFTTMLINAGGLDWFKYDWVWDKVLAVGHLVVTKRPMQRTEGVLVFGKGALVYNPQMERREKPRHIKKHIGQGETVHLSHKQNKLYQNTLINRYPTNLIQIRNTKREGLHPTQKPVALFVYLIRTYTNPGDLVLDNAAGSGTTAIAAIDTGRDWLLMEKDLEYYQIAKDRITERLKQPFLPGLGDTAHNKALQPNGYQPEQQPLFTDDESG